MAKPQPPTDEKPVKVKILFDGHIHGDKPVPRGSEIECTQHEADYINAINQRRAQSASASSTDAVQAADTGAEQRPGDN